MGELKTYNILGQDITYSVNILEKNTSFIIIDLYNLATGMYVLRIGDESVKVYSD
jgi:hypothetical protein